jgi:hypothetical protein
VVDEADLVFAETGFWTPLRISRLTGQRYLDQQVTQEGVVIGPDDHAESDVNTEVGGITLQKTKNDFDLFHHIFEVPPDDLPTSRRAVFWSDVARPQLPPPLIPAISCTRDEHKV